MGQRLDLQSLLEGVLGNTRVYFQPPSTTTLQYPCIVFKRSDIPSQFGDNLPYILNTEYTLTVIYKDPDSDIPNKVAKLPKCRSDRMYTADNLYHAVFKISY